LLYSWKILVQIKGSLHVLQKIKVLASALLVVTIGLLFFCERNNPYDPNSKSFIPGKKPHVAFVNKAMSAFLLDTISIPVVWYDTAVGGGKEQSRPGTSTGAATRFLTTPSRGTVRTPWCQKDIPRRRGNGTDQGARLRRQHKRR